MYIGPSLHLRWSSFLYKVKASGCCMFQGTQCWLLQWSYVCLCILLLLLLLLVVVVLLLLLIPYLIFLLVVELLIKNTVLFLWGKLANWFCVLQFLHLSWPDPHDHHLVLKHYLDNYGDMKARDIGWIVDVIWAIWCLIER